MKNDMAVNMHGNTFPILSAIPTIASNNLSWAKSLDQLVHFHTVVGPGPKYKVPCNVRGNLNIKFEIKVVLKWNEVKDEEVQIHKSK